MSRLLSLKMAEIVFGNPVFYYFVFCIFISGAPEMNMAIKSNMKGVGDCVTSHLYL